MTQTHSGTGTKRKQRSSSVSSHGKSGGSALAYPAPNEQEIPHFDAPLSATDSTQPAKRQGRSYTSSVATSDCFEHLADLLVHLRETYPARRGLTVPGGPEMRLTAKAVADALNHAGYSMTSGSYSMLEQGKSLPKNPRLFFEALEKCLAIDPRSNEAKLLRDLYLRDYAERALGPGYTYTGEVQGKASRETNKVAYR